MLRFRPRRLKFFYEIFDVREGTRILDLGGGPHLWDLAQVLGLPLPRVTILNIRPPGNGSLPACATWVIGDAVSAPFDDFSFDVAFSNSLIEHLTDWDSQCTFASEVRRLAPNYFVQTPDRHFPVEPHFITPFMHWLPKHIQRLLVRHFTVWGILQRPNREFVESVVAELRLLSRTEMTRLFPDANIVTEKFAGISKSILACRKQS
jgi:SAM-dependent methyltransferase